ncbi:MULTISPECIES: DUF397 domain-containing protein [unclassified Amycolatopsis]|uniref:DUF397 domain-containing protein n=1 Tax=unclassified Amycolatopsis TaxID=2618356 RepID=UPI001C698CFD|nr:DUF397 domain-containing protein [Amycolatopsis sp. DSM 110486]QYN20053.1 DUF397 domain-containing protein [Amycolatopsis sp. DSM 110486]
MNETRLWRTSSYSSSEGQCVEVAVGIESVGIRDTKDRQGGELDVRAAAWPALLEQLGR